MSRGAENEKGKIYGFSTSLLPSPNTLMYSLPPPPPREEGRKKIGADTKPQQFILGFVIFLKGGALRTFFFFETTLSVSHAYLTYSLNLVSRKPNSSCRVW